MYIIAALAFVAALVTWWIHTFIGHRVVLKPMLEASFNPFARATMEVCWHITTVFLALVVLMIGWAAVHPDANFSRLLLGFAFAGSCPSALLFLVVSKRRFKRMRTMPQSYLLGSIAVLSFAAMVWPVTLALQTTLAMLLAGILVCLAWLHFAWASGSHWPAKSRAELSALVVGQKLGQKFPGKTMTALVAWFLLSVGLFSALAVLLPIPKQVTLIVFWVLAVVFSIRGLVGFADTVLRPWTKKLPFKHWNRVLYSPVSLIMGLMALGLALGGI